MSSQWVPFREKTRGSPSGVEYGGVSWHPQYIPFGTEIEFDVGDFNKWLNSMSIAVPIELVTHGSHNERPTPTVSGITKYGEASAISTTHQSQKKPQLWNILSSPNQDVLRYNINLGGIVDFLQQKNPSLDHEKFIEEYSKLANIALKSGIPAIVIFNLIHLALEDNKIAWEVSIDVMVFLVKLLSILSEIPYLNAHSFGENVMLIIYIHLLYQIAFPLTNIFIVLGTFLTKDKKTINNEHSYFNYLIKDESHLSKFMKSWLPILSMKYFSLPLLFAFTNKNQFIRPVQK